MDVDEALPPLAPEIKINMKLDDIIKYEQMKAGVSHNNQFKRNKNISHNVHYKRGKNFRPYFGRRKYKSQNWRLRGNGPNTPRFRNQQSYFQRSGKVREFLERKRRTTPMNSVFQRLGWNALQESARAKVWHARNYYRPQRPRFGFQMQSSTYDPNRVKKMIQAAKIYTSRDDGLGGQIDDDGSIQRLSKGNLEKLNQALGGKVTSFKEEQSDAGTVITTITTRVDPTSNMNNSFNHGNTMNVANGYNYGVPMNGVFNRTYPMNGINGMNGVYGMYGNNHFNAMNSMNSFNSNSSVNSMAMGGYGMNGTSSFYAINQNEPLNQMYNNSITNGSSTNFISNNRLEMNQLNNIRTNGISRTFNNCSVSDQQLIQSLNEQKPVTGLPGLSKSNWGKGIDVTLPLHHRTTQSISSRFGGSSSGQTP